MLGPLLLISLSLGLSNFAAAIGMGVSGADGRTRLTMAVAFAFFEALMPIIGLLLGQTLVVRVGTTGHYLGAILLVLTGFYGLWQGRKTNGAPTSPRATRQSPPKSG